MSPLNSIRQYLLHDELGVANHLEDFVSVPAFIYRVREDNYLSIAKTIINAMALDRSRTSFQTFLKLMHPKDCLRVLSLYMHDVPLLTNHRQGEPLPTLRGFEFSIKDKNLRWRKGMVKLDVAGYDACGYPDKLFGVFWLDDIPLAQMEKTYEKPVEEIFDSLAGQISYVKNRLTKNIIRTAAAAPELTVREEQVLQGLAKGFSTRELAVQFGVSFNTIETYRKHLLFKFQARNTVQMVMKVARLLPETFNTNSQLTIKKK